MNKLKKGLLTFLMAGFLISSVGGVIAYTPVSAAGTSTKTGFYMEDGAAVRLKEEYENFGIRFSANIGERVEGATYKMLIVPKSLVDIYEDDETADKGDIVTYLTQYAASKGGKLSIVEHCDFDNDGKMYGALVDVLWENINRKFVGIAFYEKDGQITVAQYADDGERSIVDVAQKALESGDYDSDTTKKGCLVDKIRMGEKQEKGYAKEDTYIYEDFRYASGAGKGNIKHSQIEVGIADTWSYPSIVNNGSDKGLQFKQINDAYGLLTLDFGTVKAGTYKFSFTMTENAIGTLINENNPEKGTIDYRNWKLMGWDGTSYSTDHGFLYKNYYVGNDTFEYYFTQSEDGEVKFGIAGMSAANTWTGQGQILLDDMCLEPVENVPAKTNTLNVFSSMDFKDMASPFIPLSYYGIYTKANMTLSVDKSAETLTGTSSDYGLITFYLGDVEPGNYKLKLNAEMTNGFPAVLGGATLSVAEDGSVAYNDHIYFNYKGKNVSAASVQTLSQYYPDSDGNYELTFTVSKKMTNFGLYIANNVEKVSSITLKDISFEKDAIDYTKGYTFDFEKGVSFNAPSMTGIGNINFLGYLATNNLLRNNESTNAIEIVDNVTIGDQQSKALAVNNNLGWKSYFALNLGYLKAGTYSISVDLKATSNGFSRGTFSYRFNDTDTDFSIKYSGEGTYTFTFTIATDGEVFFKYTEPNTNVNASVNYLDNLTITKTA